jgi:hypothetical protein
MGNENKIAGDTKRRDRPATYEYFQRSALAAMASRRIFRLNI